MTGGYIFTLVLDSTELLRPGSDWQVITARLPRPMKGVRVTTLDNRVLLFGGEKIVLLLLHLPHTDLSYRGA